MLKLTLIELYLLVNCIVFVVYMFLQFKAKGTLMQMVGADWLRSDKREDDLAGRAGSIVQVIFHFRTFFSSHCHHELSCPVPLLA